MGGEIEGRLEARANFRSAATWRRVRVYTIAGSGSCRLAIRSMIRLLAT